MNGISNSDVGSLIVGLAIFAILIGFYFLPSIVASNRSHSNARSIFVLNLFLGWTFVGWVVALIWAFSDNTVKRETVSNGESSNPRIWWFVAIFAAIVIVAFGLVTGRVPTWKKTQEVVRLAPSTAKVPENESPNSTIHTDVEGFRQSMSNPGFKTYTNGRYGFRVDFPESFIAQRSPENGDGATLKSEDGKATLVVWGSNNAGFTLQDQFDSAIRDVHGALGYNRIGNSWFVVTWIDGENTGYTKEFVGTGSQDSFTIMYPVEQNSQYDSIVTKIERSFKPGDIGSSH